MQFFFKFSICLKFFIIKCFGKKGKTNKSSSTQSGLISLLWDHWDYPIRPPHPCSHCSLQVIVDPSSLRHSFQATQSLSSPFQTLPLGSLELPLYLFWEFPLPPGPNGNQALPWDTASCSRGSYFFSHIPSTSEPGVGQVFFLLPTAPSKSFLFLPPLKTLVPSKSAPTG